MLLCSGACGPGSYHSAARKLCVPCAVGSYQPSSGMSTCTTCPDDMITYGRGAVYAFECCKQFCSVFLSFIGESRIVLRGRDKLKGVARVVVFIVLHWYLLYFSLQSTCIFVTSFWGLRRPSPDLFLGFLYQIAVYTSLGSDWVESMQRFFSQTYSKNSSSLICVFKAVFIR